MINASVATKISTYSRWVKSYRVLAYSDTDALQASIL